MGSDQSLESPDAAFNAALMALPTSDRKIATEIALQGGRFFAAIDPIDPTKVVLFDLIKKTASEWKNGNQ